MQNCSFPSDCQVGPLLIQFFLAKIHFLQLQKVKGSSNYNTDPFTVNLGGNKHTEEQFRGLMILIAQHR